MATEGDRLSRPGSLLLESNPPEREPLKFDVQLVGAPPEVEQLVNNIKQVAEDFLYHWKTFPIVLPATRFAAPGGRPSEILAPPPCDELDISALDAGIEPHPLSPKQLQSIREKGEFEVPSRHFPGQTQVWRVAGWLQRGRVRAKEELYCHVARAAALIVVVARNRLVKDEPLSVIAGGKALMVGLTRFLDLIFGMPSLAARDLEKKIRDERSRYLVAELVCLPSQQNALKALANWVARALRRTDEDMRPPPALPCVYTTPQDTLVDLRLYRREVLRRAAPTLQVLLDRESRGWFLHFRERLAADLVSQKVPTKDIEEEVKAAGMREYVSRVCTAIRSSPQLQELGEGIPELLADMLQATAIVSRAQENVQRKIEVGLASAEARIYAAHPILARADCWRKEKLAHAHDRLTSELRWSALEEAAVSAAAHHLTQYRYFLLRDLVFLRDREPLLTKELELATVGTRSFPWATRIWFPQNFEVRRHSHGRSERVPTVVTSRAPSVSGPDAGRLRPVYVLHKEKLRWTTTRWPGWRLANTAHRCWCWSWNMMYWVGVVLSWRSPLSLRALLSTAPLVPHLELSQVNGTLFPKPSSETQTMWTRLLLLWRHVSKERTKFETEPDTGLLGKGLSRQANRLWNYGIVGGLGTIVLLLLFPIAAILWSSICVMAAVTVPLWMSCIAVGVHGTNMLLYDLDCPDPGRLNRWCVLLEVLIWQILIQGILQPLTALLAAFVVCPLGSLLLIIGGAWWWVARGAWEWVTWRVVLRAGRVPAHDTLLAGRVTPDNHKLYYSITGGQALAAVVARAELEEVTSWCARTETAIERPLRDYASFVDACFGPFSLQIAKTGAYKQLEKECAELTSSLKEKVSQRKRDLSLTLSDTVRARVRMTSAELKRAIKSSARELSRVYAGVSDDWWTTRGLAPGDWTALAANTLAEVFDPEVLSALQEGSARVPADVGRSEAARRWEARADTHPPDVLANNLPDGEEWWWWWGVWGESVRVAPPALSPAALCPRAPPHPPVPLPAAVALLLHDRDSECPVLEDSEVCAEVLRTLEDTAPTADVHTTEPSDVERYRGGGSVDSASASDDTQHDVPPDTPHDTPPDTPHDAPTTPHDLPPRRSSGGSMVSVSGMRVSGGVSACRWTLTGRGVRADLASPEDVSDHDPVGRPRGTRV